MSLRADAPVSVRRAATAVLVLVGVGITVLATATVAAAPRPQPGVRLRAAHADVNDGVYRVNARAGIRLTEPVRRALNNGVELGFTWQFEIEQHRSWWLNANVATVSLRYRLRYHALSHQYVVANRNTQSQRSYTRLRDALAAIGRLDEFPVLDRSMLDDSAVHTGYLRLYLEHSSLPLPLRLTALYASAWDLNTDWRAWPFG